MTVVHKDSLIDLTFVGMVYLILLGCFASITVTFAAESTPDAAEIDPLPLDATPQGSHLLTQDRPYQVVTWQVDGARRTNLQWLQEYLNLEFPASITRSELARLEAKIHNTEAFSYVRVRLQQVMGHPGQYRLDISLVEKWTTIPVVRGAFGGGTPLVVVGVYDVHTFGKLWTVGAEGRKYGNAPWGGVVWAKAPRWLQGKHEIGLELWKDNRIRDVFDPQDKAVGRFDSRSSMLRTYFTMPLAAADMRQKSRVWQAGLDLKIRAQEPALFTPEKGSSISLPPQDIVLPSKRAYSTAVQGKLILDDINISELNMEGLRFIAAAGPLWDEGHQFTSSELEAFYFVSMGSDWNLGLHGLVGSTNARSLQNLYFLGGFESIRGIPDGVLYGNQAAYTNLELRKIQARFSHLVIQSLAFIDSGTAAFQPDKLRDNLRTSAGIGVRLAIPQVHRLVFRIDYAWSLDNPGVRGFAIGMNQFFQPYKPL